MKAYIYNIDAQPGSQYIAEGELDGGRTGNAMHIKFSGNPGFSQSGGYRIALDAPLQTNDRNGKGYPTNATYLGTVTDKQNVFAFSV
jgi:hypothetical protein